MIPIGVMWRCKTINFYNTYVGQELEELPHKFKFLAIVGINTQSESTIETTPHAEQRTAHHSFPCSPPLVQNLFWEALLGE